MAPIDNKLTSVTHVGFMTDSMRPSQSTEELSVVKIEANECYRDKIVAAPGNE
jgi:hypothetical protein